MSRPRNILLLMTDQHRADHVGWHPRRRWAMPHLDRLAEGTVFDTCITSDPICTPARTALLTGKYPHQIGTLEMSGDLSPQHPTYARALQGAGWHTVAVGKLHWLQTWKWGHPRGQGLDLVALNGALRGFGFDRIWETAGKQLAQRNHCDWCAHLAAKGMLEAYRDHAYAAGENYGTLRQTEFTGDPWPLPEEDYVDIVTGDQVLRHLRERPSDKSFCLFASFCGPHAPFDPPRRFLDAVPEEPEPDDLVPGDEPVGPIERARLRRLRRAYKAMLAVIDEQIGRIFAELQRQGLWDDTVVIFTSDHGEMLGDRGHFQKSRPWWQSCTVPTAIRHPDHLRRGRITAPVELTDLTATILDIAGLDPRRALSRDWPAFHDRVPCRSLLPLLRGEAESVRDWAFSECGGKWQMIQDRRWKYLRWAGGTPDAPRESLYDLAADPDETRDLAADPARAGELACGRARLLDLLCATPAAQTTWAPLISG